MEVYLPGVKLLRYFGKILTHYPPGFPYLKVLVSYFEVFLFYKTEQGFLIRRFPLPDQNIFMVTPFRGIGVVEVGGGPIGLILLIGFSPLIP